MRVFDMFSMFSMFGLFRLWWCQLTGQHRPIVERRGNQIFLKCPTCEMRSGGWSIPDQRLREGTDRRSTEARRHGDRRDHERRHPHDRRGQERRGEL
jgi:hypothetical protein